MNTKVWSKLRKEVEEHIVDYVLLTCLSLLTVVLLITFTHNRFIQIMLLVVFTLLYFMWGIVHHIKEKTLHRKIVIEYLLIAGCILVTLLSFF